MKSLEQSVGRWIRLAGAFLPLFFCASVSNAGEIWQDLLPGGAHPQSRAQCAMVYDGARQRMLVYGGWHMSYSFGDNKVWALSLDANPAWTELQTGGAAHYGGNDLIAGCDSLGDRLLVYRGSNQIWQLTLGPSPTWSQLTPTGTFPSFTRFGVFDPPRRRIVVRSYDGNVWQLDLVGTPAWSTLTPPAGPAPGVEFLAAVFDSRRERMVLVGNSETWALDLSGPPVWNQILTTGQPQCCAGAKWQSFAYDPIRDRILVFVGGPGSNWLRELSFTTTIATWASLDPDMNHSQTYNGATATYDPYNDRFIVVGGSYRGQLDEFTVDMTWSLRWQNTTAGVPENPTAGRLALSLTGANPTRSGARMELTVPKRGRLSVGVYDVRGSLMQAIAEGAFEPGRHPIEWDGRDANGRKAPPGIYFVRAASSEQHAALRVVRW